MNIVYSTVRANKLVHQAARRKSWVLQIGDARWSCHATVRYWRKCHLNWKLDHLPTVILRYYPSDIPKLKAIANCLYIWTVTCKYAPGYEWRINPVSLRSFHVKAISIQVLDLRSHYNLSCNPGHTRWRGHHHRVLIIYQFCSLFTYNTNHHRCYVRRIWSLMQCCASDSSRMGLQIAICRYNLTAFRSLRGFHYDH
jgi:hypothetical protein